MIRNLHFYNSNETRCYPLADSASAASTDGVRLPNDLIADLNLRYPLALGDYPFLASITVTDSLVSVTFQCAADPDDASTFAPMAVIAMSRKEIVTGRHYPVQPQYPGVGGWIVFGEGINPPTRFTGRFAGPAAGMLAPRAARRYRPLPLKSMAKLYDATELTGLVLLKGEDPIEVVKEQREIEGVLRDVIAIRLVQPSAPTDNLQPDQPNVFEHFAGPCGARPESLNCGEPRPLEFINAVPPDCDGNLTIEFSGCAAIAQVLQECGIVIDCGLGLIDACIGDKLPEEDGKLRTEYDNECDVHSETPSLGFISESALPVLPAESLSVSETEVGSLPYLETFDDSRAQNWHLVLGYFQFAPEDSPSEPAGAPAISLSTESTFSAGQRNLSIWNGFDHSTLHRKVTVDLKLTAGPIGTKHNAAVVVNYRPAADFSGRNVYFLVEISYDDQQFRIWYFNGTSFAMLAFADLVAIGLNNWYRVTVSTLPSGSGVAITATMTAITGPALSVTLGPLMSNRFLPDTGRFGLHTDRAYARISFFKLEEI